MDNAKHLVPTNFRVPLDMNHRWIFVAGPLRSEIKGVPGCYELRIEDWKLTDNHDLDVNAINLRHFDWMAKTVEHMRAIK